MKLSSCLALGALLLAGACGAAEPDPRSDMFRGSQSVDDRSDQRPTMSLDALRKCVALEYETRQLRSDFDSAKLALEHADRDFKSIDYVVATLRQSLDLADARAVEDFNQKVAEQNRALAALNARIEPHNRLIGAIDAATTRFNDECTGPYLEDDMHVVRREREAAIRAELEAARKR
jgi:hypothetical protein